MGIVDQEVWVISKDEVRAAMKRMKSGKAVGLDDIHVEIFNSRFKIQEFICHIHK